MSARLPSLSRRQVVKALCKAGFAFDPAGGKGGHGKLVHPTRGRTTSVPSGKTVAQGTLRDILNQPASPAKSSSPCCNMAA